MNVCQCVSVSVCLCVHVTMVTKVAMVTKVTKISYQMTSFGATNVVRDNYMPTFKVQGQIYHRAGSLLPLPDMEPKYLQIYFIKINVCVCVHITMVTKVAMVTKVTKVSWLLRLP